jgi:hypothetical protein
VGDTARTAEATIDDRSSQRFTRLFLGVFLAFTMATAGLALAIDPLRTFGTNRVTSVLTGERDEKPPLFLQRRPAPQAIVIGTSRVMKLRPACIQEVTTLPAFNFGLSSSMVEDWLAVYRFVTAHGSIRELIIGADVDAFDNRADVNDPRLTSSPYLRPYVEGSVGLTWTTATRALFGWQAFRYGVRSLQYYLFPKTKPVEALHFEADGYLRYDKIEDEMRRGVFAAGPRIQDNARRFRGPMATTGFTKLSPYRLELFQKLVRAAHDAGTQVDVYIPPLHRAIEAALEGQPIESRRRELETVLRQLVDQGTIRYLPVSTVADFGGDPEGFFDGVHMNEANNDRVILKMFGHPHGCGM